MRAYAPVVEHAEKAGLNINFEAMQRRAGAGRHRLIHWAGIEGRQTAAVSALFKAYFVDARDIGAAEVLADIADGIEMDAAVVTRLLKPMPMRGHPRPRRAQPQDGRELGADLHRCQPMPYPGAAAELWAQVIRSGSDQRKQAAIIAKLTFSTIRSMNIPTILPLRIFSGTMPECALTTKSKILHGADRIFGLIAMMIATIAFSIDAMLPALPEIAAELSQMAHRAR